MRHHFCLLFSIPVFLFASAVENDLILLDNDNGNNLERSAREELSVPNSKLVQESRIDIVCDACEEVFDEVKQIVVDVASVSEDSLKETIGEVCDKINIRFVSNVCKRIDDDLIKKLHNLITKVDKQVVPENCCKTIQLC